MAPGKRPEGIGSAVPTGGNIADARGRDERGEVPASRDAHTPPAVDARAAVGPPCADGESVADEQRCGAWLGLLRQLGNAREDPVQVAGAGGAEPRARRPGGVGPGGRASCGRLLTALAAWNDAEGCQVMIGGDLHATADGQYWQGSNTIWVRERDDAAAMFAALVHETAHALTYPRLGAAYDAARGEALCEGVAFAVCDHFGVADAASAAGYLARCLGDDRSVWEACLPDVRRTAAEIVAALEAALLEPAA